MTKQMGYCVKCRTKREMKNVTIKAVGNRVQVKGVCSKCGTNMCTFAAK